MGREVKPPGSNAFRDANRSWWLPLRALPRLFRQASGEWFDDNASRLGAAVAFYTLLSLAPVFVIAVALAAVVYGQEAAEGRLASEIGGVAGAEVARAIQEIIKGGYQPRIGAIATLLGLATLAFGASSVFVELRDAMNTIWHVSASPLPKHCRNGYPADQGSLLFLRDGAGHRFPAAGFPGVELLDRGDEDLRAAAAAMLVISYLLVAVLFAALYKTVPDVATAVERRRPGSRNHFIAVHGRQATSGVLLRACQMSGLPIVPQARRLSYCSGYTTLLSYSFGGPNSPRFTPRPWDPSTSGTSRRPDAAPPACLAACGCREASSAAEVQTLHSKMRDLPIRSNTEAKVLDRHMARKLLGSIEEKSHK